MKKILLYTLICLTQNLIAQYDHIPVFPALQGEDLYDELILFYTPETVYDYGPARDILFGEVYVVNDTVKGIYTDFARYLDPNEDPTDYLFNNGSTQAINTEHAYPQSKGASAYPAKSDMHHLYPSRAIVNTARGSDPFSDISDTKVDDWYYLDIKMSSIPSQNRDLYSEDDNEKFEPRESVKGNIARAMFYFYTIYRPRADAADPDYFEIQRQTLCDWHFQDPVDQLEWERSFQIGTIQGGTANPFVMDCSVASRMYCNVDENCALLDPVQNIPNIHLKVFPNPTTSHFNVDINLPKETTIQVQFVNVLGQIILDRQFDLIGQQQLVFDEDLKDGVYFLLVSIEDIVYTKKLIVHN